MTITKKHSPNKKAAPAVTGSDLGCLLEGKHKHDNGSEPPPPKKIQVCVEFFIERGTRGMNTLEAKDLFGDTCLHTSVSTLHNKHNICILRKPERIKNRAGTMSRFMRYWLNPNDLNKAKRLHAHLLSQRGLLPLYEVEQEVS